MCVCFVCVCVCMCVRTHGAWQQVVDAVEQLLVVQLPVCDHRAGSAAVRVVGMALGKYMGAGCGMVRIAVLVCVCGLVLCGVCGCIASLFCVRAAGTELWT